MGQFILKHSWVTQKNTWHTGRCPEYKYYNYFVKYSWEQGSSGRVRKLRPLSFRLLTIPVLVSTWFSLIFLIKFKKKNSHQSQLHFGRPREVGFFLSLHKNAHEQETPSPLVCPLFSQQHHNTSDTRFGGCRGDRKQFSETSWVTYTLAQSWHHLSRESLRSHR